MPLSVEDRCVQAHCWGERSRPDAGRQGWRFHPGPRLHLSPPLRARPHAVVAPMQSALGNEWSPGKLSYPDRPCLGCRAILDPAWSQARGGQRWSAYWMWFEEEWAEQRINPRAWLGGCSGGKRRHSVLTPRSGDSRLLGGFPGRYSRQAEGPRVLPEVGTRRQCAGPRTFHRSRVPTRRSVPHALWTGMWMSPALGAIPQPSDTTYSGK